MFATAVRAVRFFFNKKFEKIIFLKLIKFDFEKFEKLNSLVPVRSSRRVEEL